MDVLKQVKRENLIILLCGKFLSVLLNHQKIYAVS